MKKRVRKIANFFAFNLLFFALYLNFIHKDKVAVAPVQTNQQNKAAFSGTVLVNNPEKYLEKKNETPVTAQQPGTQKTPQEDVVASKLSVN